MEKKKKLSLPAKIFIGMLAGIIVGLLFIKNPAFTTDYLKPIGTIYINLLKFLVVPPRCPRRPLPAAAGKTAAAQKTS